MKKISIIIPCYNCQEYIQFCLHSVFEQTIGLSQLEIILLDDASTDGTLNVLMQYEKKYPEDIMLIPLSENGKQGKARNIGMSYATGEYVLFLDADDVLHKVACEHLYNTAVKQQADIVNYLKHDANDKDRMTGEWDYYKNNQKELVETVNLDSQKERKIFIMKAKGSLGCIFKLYRNDFLREHQFLFAEGVAFEEPAFTYPMQFFEKRHSFLNEKLYGCWANPMSTIHFLTKQEERKCDNLDATMLALRQIVHYPEAMDYTDEIEFFFIEQYFIMTLYMLYARGFQMDLPMYQRMKKTMMELFPDFRDNIYLQIPDYQVYCEILKCLDMNISEENIETLNSELNRILGEITK